MKHSLKAILTGSVLIGLATGSYSAENHEHEHSEATASQQQEPLHESTQVHDQDDHDEAHDEDHAEGHVEHLDTNIQEDEDVAQAHTEHDDHSRHDKHEDHDEEATVALSPEQMAQANIKATSLTPRTMAYRIYAPGEIKANGYTSYIVSPRVDSVVLRRHAALGDHVEKGQALVSLFSETVAQAQGNIRVASSEWHRVKRLGQKAVGDKRFVSAQTDYEAAYGRLLAYGLSEAAIQDVITQVATLGEYTLNAATAGAVLTDDFHQGQRVESGESLMKLADEHELWVEARLASTAQIHLPKGTEAEVIVGNDVYRAQVTQEAHTIDPQTRTRVVRLLLDNEAHRLHPGLFADVHFVFTTEEPVLAVSESALMRSADGDWTVFVETQKGQFTAQEVTLGRPLGKWREIKGINPGTRVVTQGAFFVASEIAKGGFDPHNH